MTRGCTARAEENVHSSPSSPAGSESPPDDVTINTTDDTVTSGQQAPTGKSMIDEPMLDASGARTKDQYKSEDEETRLRRWEGGVEFDWVNSELAEGPVW
jgi:hypothetical protein